MPNRKSSDSPCAADLGNSGAECSSVSKEQVREIFSGIAKNYERFNHISSLGLDRHWLRKLVQLAPIQPDSRVLDVAGGTGEVTFAVCEAKPCKSVLLTDLTPEMLDIAESRIERGDSKGVSVETRVVDAQAMPFDDESFDVVTMAYGIRNMPDRMAALRQIHRVLVPGGTACILEFSTPRPAIVRPFHRAYLKWGIPLIGKLITGQISEFRYLSQSIFAFPEQEAFAAMLGQAGFAEVSYKNLCMGTVAIHIAKK